MTTTLQDEGYHQGRFGMKLREGNTGGLLMIAAMVLGLLFANTPLADGYFEVRDAHLGIPGVDSAFHTVGEWASEGLLAVFFFMTGLELKSEFVDGELRRIRKAIVPVAAAFGGVAVPAVLYTVINLMSGDAATLKGWATPTATDIAFAVSVLAVVGSALPTAMRTFLLTLAVVDDLIAIVIIAVVYSEGFNVLYLALAILPAAAFWVLTHRWPRFFAYSRWAAWVILLPIGIVTWVLIYSAGIHATIAGVLLGFMVPVLHRSKPRAGEAPIGLAPRLSHRFSPLSNGIAIPVFAFFASGVAVGGWSGVIDAFTDPVAIGVVVGLVVGKTIGIFGSTWVLTHVSSAEIDEDMTWTDVFGLAMMGGIGFTVALLVAELSFGLGTIHDDHAKVGVLSGSLLAAVLGGILLSFRNAHYKRLRAAGHPVDTYDGAPPDASEAHEAEAADTEPRAWDRPHG
ncbi:MULTISPECIES: Na+/H+ antiporter NhaA [Kocuria]|uniref:Na+/H+ antiporter NhaA n=1 Tax=Kocuria TaxID=57493 RepID=UPI00080A8E37|nr:MULTISPECIES: Na+/H+ antiporter NhaA [Kocuria]RUQ21199.1 Na+/H+ antiporter NhaA [Kocuria sp. HSID16901]